MPLCDFCSPETESLEEEEECDRCGYNARVGKLREEIDLEGKPSQVLVVEAAKHEDIEYVKKTWQTLIERTELDKKERKQVAIFYGDLEFEMVDLESEEE